MGQGPGFVQTTSVFSSITGVLSSTALSEPVQAASKQLVHVLYIAAKQGFESWHASGVYMLISLLSCLSKLQNGAMMIPLYLSWILLGNVYDSHTVTLRII